MAWELVILDCDGVLVDSEPLSNRILAERLTAIGLPTTTADSMRLYMGRSWASCVELIEERLGRPLPADFGEDYHAELFAAFTRELRPVPGVPEVLERLGALACVASSGSHERIRRALAATGLLPRFEGRIFSAADVPRGKPAPDLFLHAAERMGARPEACAVVEDSPAGVQAARAAGMAVFGFARLTPAASLEGSVVFEAMAELPALLSGCAPRSGGGP
jgi:HAD superfamily hydrolase (TIGR01509 family)